MLASNAIWCVKTFADNGIGIIETAMAWWSSHKDLTQRVSIKGGALIDQAQAQGRGVLLVGAHYTSLDLGGILLAQHYPYYATYQRHGNALMDCIIRRGRLNHLPGIIERQDIRQVIRLLKQGKIVWACSRSRRRSTALRICTFFWHRYSHYTYCQPSSIYHWS